MKKSKFIFLIALLIMGLFVGTVSAEIGGSGTENDPWTINSLDDLKVLSGTGYASFVGADKYFVLTTDITDDGSFASIGKLNTYPFNGHFLGQNHSIYNLHTPFFTQLKGGTLKDLNFNNVLTTNLISGGSGSYSNFGSSSIVDNVTVKYASLHAPSNTYYGLLSNSFGGASGITILKNCNFENIYFEGIGVVNLFGQFMDSGDITIDNCHFKNCLYNVKSGSFLGFPTSGSGSHNVSFNNCSIENCFFNSISSTALLGCSGFGGVSTLVKTSSVTNCTVNNSTFIALTYAAGIFGDSITQNNFPVSCENVIVKNCIFKADRANGICQLGSSALPQNYIYKNCKIENVNFDIGRTYYPLSDPTKFTNQGSTSSGITTNSNVYLRLLSGASLTNDSPQTAQKSTGEMVTFTLTGQQGAAIYLQNNQLNSGYNFGNYGGGGTQVGNNPFTASYSSEGTKNVTLTLTGWNGSSTVSGGTLRSTAYIKIPYIPTLRGNGTSSDPYQVGSSANLQEWGEHADYYNNMYMIITADFVPATTVSAFAGNLAGGNHTLTNARLPLFNTLGGTVNNLKFTNSIVSGNGILANTSSAAISNITADDCFVGGSTTGGLVGNATGSFTDCTVNHITVKGSSTAGGIAGAGNITVTRCKVLNSDLLAPTTYGVCA